MGLLDRWSSGRPDPAPARRGLTASATNVDLGSRPEVERLKKLQKRQPWQAEAWEYRDGIGEVRYAMGFLQNACSQVRVTPAWVAEPDTDPVPLDEAEGVNSTAAEVAIAALAALGADRQSVGSQILGPGAENLEVAGEGYLVGQLVDGEEEWSIRSTDEFKVTERGVALSPGPEASSNEWEELDPATSYFARIWTPHPRYQRLADSPMRALRDVCEELLIVGRQIRNAGRSRAAGNGILAMPSEMDLVDTGGANTDDPETSSFWSELQRSLLAPIADEGAASALVPLMVRGPGEYIDKIKHITLERPVSKDLMDRQDKALARIAMGLDVPPEVILGMADVNHWCVDDETEVLTRRGWLRQHEVRVGDVALTLNHETGLAEWQPILDLYRADVVGERMVRMEGSNHSSVTTPNHRWPVTAVRQLDHEPVVERSFVWTEDLTYAHHVTTGAPCADQPTEAKHLDAVVELVGWFWTEGHVFGGGGVSIAQSHTVNEPRVARIRAALTSLYGPARDNLRSLPGPAWRETVQANTHSHGGPVTVFRLNRFAAEPLLAAAPDKIVTLDFVTELTPAQLELFIDVSCMGDGQHYRGGRCDIWQRDPRALDAFEWALILSGRMTTRTTADNGERVSAWPQTSIRPVKAAAARTAAGMRTEDVAYTGTLWCPVTPNSTWLARRRGTVYYTGNTAWQVDDSTFRHHIKPLVVRLVDGLTAGYLRTVLAAAGIPPETARRLVVWYDATPLVQRPNRGADAKTAHEAGALSDASLLEALGFDPATDAPSPDELLRRMALKRGTVDAGLEAALLQLVLRLMPERDRIELPAAVPGGAVQDSGQAPAEDQPAGDAQTPQPTTGIRAAASNEGENRAEPRVLRAYTAESRRLAAIDRQLRDRVGAAADAAVRRTLERAGNRLRSRANAEARAVIRPVPPRDAARALGPALRASIDVTDDQLLDGAWTDLADQWQAWTAEAQAQALTTARGLVPEDRRDETAEGRLQARWDAHTADGWEFLQRGLDQLARRLLYADPDAADALTAAGEGAASPVPFGLVRGAVALAGGLPAAHPGLSVDGVSLDPLAPATGGFGTGDDVLEALLVPAGVETLGYEWVYGISTRHFAPHRALDGVVFPDFGAPVLANHEASGWPASTLAPGDHAGCHCDANPVYADAATPLSGLGPAGRRDQVGDITYDSSYLDFLRAMARDDIAAGRTDTDAVKTVAEADRIANHRPNGGP